jgi:3-oxoacyl-[acyl-carrier-protein] synthase II
MRTVPISITGVGILNGLGIGRAAFWRELIRGNSGITPIRGFDTGKYVCNLGAEIDNFNAREFMEPRFYRRLSRQSRLAVAASIEAVKDSGLKITDQNRHRIGVVFGTAFGSTEQTDGFFVSLLNHGPQAAEPILFPDTVPNAPASHIAMYHGLKGPNSTFCQNHLSGECALAYGIALLEQDQADVVLVGSVDELSSILFHSLASVRALKPIQQRETLQPSLFPTGKGFIAGEGATCLVLEREDFIERTEKKSYGTVLSLALTSGVVAQAHYEAAGRSMARGMTTALQEANIKIEEVGILGLAANGVDELENAELEALEEVFGNKWHSIPRLPIRYFVGDFGGAGLLSVATILLSLAEGTIPPAAQGPSLTGPFGEAQRFACAIEKTLVAGMAVGSTFGGGSGCTILGKALE